MGYWIIVILIVLGGVLVLIAVASVASNDSIQQPSDQPKSNGLQTSGRFVGPLRPETNIPLCVFMPQLWLQGEQSVPDLEFSGMELELQRVRSSMLKDVSAIAESPATSLADSITVILVGADDFLAGHSLDSVLDELDRLLDRLVKQPAMAVVCSIPDIGTALSQALSAVPAESITATVALWNNALAELVQTYAAEFVDVGQVPVQFVNAEGKIPGLSLSATLDLSVLAVTLAQACSRAAAKVRLIQAET